ncbi:MAG: NADH-quinone oxidoreductase subunit L [Ignavibacteria bacterium]
MVEFFYLIFLFPLLGFLINGTIGNKFKSEKLIGIIASLSVFVSFVISIILLVELSQLPSESRAIIINYFDWIKAGSINSSISYVIDPLSLVMALVVTGIGFLIHIYSIGYMHGDKGFARFFAYMNLFIFAMLNLVFADNLVLVFLGWEGVGLCSYLLIGFWYEKKFTADAAKKAFIVNRIGDFGYMIAMFIVFTNFKTLSISSFLASITNYQVGDSLLQIIALSFFLAATGKSAQIPLFVWLPDAMAGPTPVSALIHAATMVTAGVYFLCRTSLLYTLSPIASNVVLVIGIATAMLAGTIAIKQNDIKKVLAYSTVSQLGFMFVAIGVRAYYVAIFHLVTHAFFKALLFLGSGSVIHGMNEEQDITKMGGLKERMKVTYITFLIGTLAISGIPPLAGFFSKDEILFKTFENAGIVFYLVLLFTAGLTAFYMYRLVTLTFFGRPRYNTEVLRPHESPLTMTLPLMLLAGLSIVGGFIGLPHFLGYNVLEHWLNPVFEKSNLIINTFSTPHSVSITVELLLLTLSVVVAVIAIILAFRTYTKVEAFPEERGFKKILANKYYIDEIYDKLIVLPLLKISEVALWKIFDVKLIDGAVNGIAMFLAKLGRSWRRFQTGVIQDYILVSVAGIVLIFIYLIFY